MASFLGGFFCSRNTLVLLNIFYIIVSFVLIGMATYAKAVASIVDYSIVGGIIACGVFLLIISLVGLLGTGLHHQVMLFVYMIVLIMLFIVQFSVACACLALNSSQQHTLFVMGWQRASTSMKYSMQKKYDCCGVTKEYQNETLHSNTDFGYGHPPCANSTQSCGNSTELCCTGVVPSQSNDTYACSQSSCWDEVHDDLSKAIRAVGFVGLFFSFTELIGIWLAYRFRNLKDPNVNPNAFL